MTPLETPSFRGFYLLVSDLVFLNSVASPFVTTASTLLRPSAARPGYFLVSLFTDCPYVVGDLCVTTTPLGVMCWLSSIIVTSSRAHPSVFRSAPPSSFIH